MRLVNAAAHMQLAQLVWMIALAITSVAATAQRLALPGCNDTCGNISIPYPFGIGRNCFLDDQSFEITCHGNTTSLKSGNFTVLNIFLEGQLEMLFPIVRLYTNNASRNISAAGGDTGSLRMPAFTISGHQNKFTTVGCGYYGFLTSLTSNRRGTSCYSYCSNNTNGGGAYDYSGQGCCQVDVPCGIKNISIEIISLNGSRLDYSYAFIAKQDSYSCSGKQIYEKLPRKLPLAMPMVVDWAMGNWSCADAPNKPNFACQENSECVDTDNKDGYRCRCKDGYQGNPYLPGGCRDTCRGLRCGSGSRLIKLAVGTGIGFIALLVSISWLYLMYQKRKLIKLKEKFFWQNGGFLLQQRLSTRKDSSQMAQIFTAEQLKKATKNYDESLIIGKGGYGTVFKGILSNNRIVAIKKSKVVDQTQVEQFINEVDVLSQINHRNVVKLLGCCLETEVPQLVYEFVNNGTLFDYIHCETKANNVSWKTRLRIAAEAAGALSYLHSAASIPIIHRDVKTTNILLDETYTAKVSDFGASRLIPLDQTELATIVQGTIGYLDPEYLQTSQLTEKSDVYSFGVVLAELLTGEKVLSFERPEEQRSLAMHFLSCLKENRLFEVLEIGLVNDKNKEEIKEVAVLATKCLSLRGDERPCMKEVAMELEGIRVMEKHPWSNTAHNLEESESLLQDKSGIYEHGGSNSSHQNLNYDHTRSRVLVPFDIGR